MTKHLYIPFLFLCHSAIAQVFYVNSVIDFPIENKVFVLDITNSSASTSYVCPATNNSIQAPEQQFTDIATNNAGGFYYVSGWGSLYKRQLNDESTCQFLGSFNTTTNALVCQSDHLIYAAANLNGICTLYQFEELTGVFSTVGNFPEGYFSAGDLFFYKQHLFLTGTNSDFTASYLISVNLQNTEESCIYMNLGNLQPYGAFTVGDETSSQVYVLTGNTINSSLLVGLDMENGTVGSVIRTFDFNVLGAASVYNLTSTESECIQMSIGVITDQSFKIQNPASDKLIISPASATADVDNITIYDMSGKIIKTFLQDDMGSMDLCEIPDGVYLLQISAANRSITKKLIITNL